MVRVLDELRMRLPDFAPRSMLDFGSGPGTVIWAAREVCPCKTLKPSCGAAQHQLVRYQLRTGKTCVLVAGPDIVYCSNVRCKALAGSYCMTHAADHTGCGPLPCSVSGQSTSGWHR